MALDDPVAQRVHDQPQHARLDRVERVARARVVHVVPRVVRVQAVVRRVVDAAKRQRRPELASLRGVVVDDVEDHLDARAVQGLDHALELAHLLAAGARGRVARVRREVADRAVAPVVRQAALADELLLGDVMDRQELDGGDAESGEVLDRRLGGQARIRAAQVVAHARVGLREAAHVDLVDHRLGPWPRRRPVVLPVEGPVDHDALRDRLGVVLVVGFQVGVGEVGGDVPQHVGQVPADRPLDRLGVRVDEQLVRVEALPGPGVVGPAHAVAVALPGSDAGEVPVPVVGGAQPQRQALLRAVVAEQAQRHRFGVLGEQREVRPVSVPGRPEGEGPARPDLAAHRGGRPRPGAPEGGAWSGTSHRTLSGGSVTGAEQGC